MHATSHATFDAITGLRLPCESVISNPHLDGKVWIEPAFCRIEKATCRWQRRDKSSPYCDGIAVASTSALLLIFIHFSSGRLRYGVMEKYSQFRDRGEY